MSFEQLGREVAEALGEGPAAERRTRQRDAVVRHALAEATPAPRRRWWLPTVVTAAAAAVVMLVLWPRDDVSRRVDPVAQENLLVQGAWLRAPADAPLELRAEDGSRVRLAAASTGRVATLSTKDVRLVLESGTLRAEVEPGLDHWSVEAGPYQVVVEGTIFTVTWTPETGALQVAVDRGKVRVRGGQIDADGLSMRAGDRLEAAVEPARVVLTRAETEEPETPAVADDTARETAPAVADDEAVEAPAERRRPARPGKAVAADPKWKVMARAGDYADALAEAERAGFGGLVRRLGADDLDLLATTARLAKNGRRAHEALSALRQRFPRAEKGRTATFLLGRVAMELRKRPKEAAKWFRTYAQENPSGALASEARGRLVLALDRAGDEAGARKAAQAYLEAHGGGPYTKLAESLASR